MPQSPFRPNETPVGLTDLFKIGIGPSSSHTIGPMRAGAHFVAGLGTALPAVAKLTATAFGSLAWTGSGHATDKAMILGLSGIQPDRVDPDEMDMKLAKVAETKLLRLSDGREIDFDPARDVVFDRKTRFPRHPNAMRFRAFDAAGEMLAEEVWYSVGGGFVEKEGAGPAEQTETALPPHPFICGETLLAIGRETGLSVAEIVLQNEMARRSRSEIFADIDRIADAMFDCIERGLRTSGELPGGLKVKRRAEAMFNQLEAARRNNERRPNEAMEYVSTFAIAVNEENAAGRRVVTAPTNGAAGVVPAVLRYYRDFCAGANKDGVRAFFLAATAIGGIIKRNASISGAEVGCQGEVGSAAAMAAAGLTAALGGSNGQIENAAEIAIEHHLGMTCDPVGGLVQIPCIERNAFGAVKAIAAASLALAGDGSHRVSLDQAVETMRQTGVDMRSKYRETSRGGLAVNVPEC